MNEQDPNKSLLHIHLIRTKVQIEDRLTRRLGNQRENIKKRYLHFQFLNSNVFYSDMLLIVK